MLPAPTGVAFCRARFGIQHERSRRAVAGNVGPDRTLEPGTAAAQKRQHAASLRPPRRTGPDRGTRNASAENLSRFGHAENAKIRGTDSVHPHYTTAIAPAGGSAFTRMARHACRDDLTSAAAGKRLSAPPGKPDSASVNDQQGPCPLITFAPATTGAAPLQKSSVLSPFCQTVYAYVPPAA